MLYLFSKFGRISSIKLSQIDSLRRKGQDVVKDLTSASWEGRCMEEINCSYVVPACKHIGISSTVNMHSVALPHHVTELVHPAVNSSSLLIASSLMASSLAAWDWHPTGMFQLLQVLQDGPKS